MLVFLYYMKSRHSIVIKNVQKMSGVHGSIILTVKYPLQLRFPPHTTSDLFEECGMISNFLSVLNVYIDV